MDKKQITVLDLLQLDTEQNLLGLRCIAGKNGLQNSITSESINRPGLALGGYFQNFAYSRVQVFGVGEATFLKNSKYQDELNNIRKIMSYDIPCAFFPNDNIPPNFFLELANERNIPILISDKATDFLVMKLFQILIDIFAKREQINAGLVEVFGIGVLIKGQKGIGKTEAILELLRRGHRLVADDVVQLKVIQSNLIMGEGRGVSPHHMEIPGIGIIDVRRLFGVGAIRDKKNVQLVIELEYYDSKKEYDRMGIDEKFFELVGVKIPYLLIPVKTAGNIPIIIEIAAMNHRLKMMGVNSAREFNQSLIRHLEIEEIKRAFFK
jgi:HPr kinase/phosphorylase